MNILSFNPGSNTLRYKLVATDDEHVLAEGMVDGVQGQQVTQAAEAAIGECANEQIDVLAFRVVHGGHVHVQPERITAQLLADLKQLTHLAPLHLPTDVAVIEAVQQLLPDVPAVAVFDTTFHQTIPEVARRYPLDERECHYVRRFGFHGLAHQFNSVEFQRLTGNAAHSGRMISLHLGGGASGCAILDGLSVDTTMGLTPLEGLAMSTRCGDLDPGLVLQLIRDGRSCDEVEELLNKRSGLLGISQSSSDIRDLEPAAQKGDDKAKLALDIYAYRVRKSVGAMMAVLGGCDALVLSGALAENSPSFRRHVLLRLEPWGIALDRDRNDATEPTAAARVCRDDADVDVWMIPTDEELQMARQIVDSVTPLTRH